jgi:metallophosphoesterase (TIGR00282 family)
MRVKVLLLGDVVGESGLAALERELPGLAAKYAPSLVVVNGENAAEGFGMTEAVLNRILTAGVDAVTSGNHIWEKREFWPLLDSVPAMLRPANYPAGLPGKGLLLLEKGGADVSWAIINLQGREYMGAIDCPFRSFDSIYAGLPLSPRPIVLVDFHAESFREKEALALYLDGRAALVSGTHTHVQTADERLLPQGTAYISDLGMTGAEESILGMDTQICLNRSRTQVAYRMECAQGPGSIQGVLTEFDGETGKALTIKRIVAQALRG